MKIKYEKEVCAFLRLPDVPKRKWDGESAFDKGVAIVELQGGGQGYAVASFDPDADEQVRIIKVFGMEPFTPTPEVYIVPDYMEKDTSDMDLDDASKKKAEEIIKEAEELEEANDGNKIELPKNEYFFDHIHNDEEAIAFITSYNRENKIRGKISQKHENIIMRLAVIYDELNKNK